MKSSSRRLLISFCVMLICVVVFQPLYAQEPTPIVEEGIIRFAVIGDYGLAGKNAKAVSDLVHSWEVDFIITVGDNNYDVGSAETIDDNVGQYYHDFIAPYTGAYGPGAEINRFFPTLGNHDWLTDDAQPYLDYFTLPGNERYYDFTAGPVHLFALDNNYAEPDGFRRSSIQAEWLQERLASSTSPWQIAYMHVPPYTSGHEGPSPAMQWPFAEWGVDAVLTGHDHDYERLMVDGIPYFVNGLGGGAIYPFETPLPESQFRYNRTYGAQLVTASTTEITFEFYSVADGGTLIDSYTLRADE